MAFFETLLVLLFVAILLLQVTRRFAVPYPTMLAVAGVVIALLPGAPHLVIEPELALALFIAPALLDSAFDLPPRELRRNWRPLVALAGVAVILTTAAVAWTAVALQGLPLAAAIALGAIVAPPDAAAAAAMLARAEIPRRMVSVLKGESLLNDGVALLIFAAAVNIAISDKPATHAIPELAFAVPGGILLGIAFGATLAWMMRWMSGTLSSTLMTFVATFGAWILAEQLHLSAILCVVAHGMTVAHIVPTRTPPRERVHTYAVWEAVVFLLNVLAFFLMGLQASEILSRLNPAEIWEACGFAAIVFGVVVVVRFAWVMLYMRTSAFVKAKRGKPTFSSNAHAVLVSWCGMRGLVTLATAMSLPGTFPERDLIVLSAFAVVLGTLVVQGLTLRPLIRYLSFPPDRSFAKEVAAARLLLLDAALNSMADRDDAVATRLRETYEEERKIAEAGNHPRDVSEFDAVRRHNIAAKRNKLAELRSEGAIDDDVFHALEQELDWAELAVTAPQELVES
ncbi:sodium:proton antiporter [Steroidobacter agaridevorans]|uniref:Sodium:proton antiporter n=1 Tax=Steroidobacter agaridevorans TaxID=2695856 RepID=A0A829YD48_9GAMM|nr:sodium:proton antiporter [Steroidobacter agaridevorans]GFE81180.1 sodium:proton antiporter [Steroidobacter agaridevorans]